MDKLNPVIAWLSTFSTMAISLSAIIALLSVLFKPVRKLIVWLYKKLINGKSKFDEVLGKIDSMETKFEKKVDDLENTLSNKIQEVSDKNDENEKDRIRWEVLSFANSCRNSRKHSKEEFTHIFELEKKYEELLKRTDDKNGVFELDYEYIKGIYAERLEKNDFLA